MSHWLRSLWDGVLFRTAPFEAMRDRRDAALHGFLIIVTVALLAGAPPFAGALVEIVRPGSPEPATTGQQGMSAFMAGLAPLWQAWGVPPEVQAQITQQASYGAVFAMQSKEAIDRLPTRLPRAIGHGLSALGSWFSRPFGDGGLPLGSALLATWLGYGIWTMLAAKLMGGKGSLTAHFGATAFFAVPHVLGFFRWIPVLGGVLAALAFVWGIAVYVKGVATAHRMSMGRAIAATFLPFGVAALLLIAFGVSLLVLVGVIVAAGA